MLIDEYDTPIKNSIFQRGEELPKIINFIKEFISNLIKSNDSVERGFINACVILSLVATTNVNDIRHFSFSQKDPFTKYYGFTLIDVKS